MKSYYFSIILFLLNLTVKAAHISDDIKSKLDNNGVSILDVNQEFSEHQYLLLETFDFNPYRNLYSERIVQIADGPRLKLKSLQEMLNAGKQIPSQLIENKKDEITDKNLKAIITLINIGFRISPAKNTETGY
jgi:hypothetical protein